MKGCILIVDYGSQYTQLIARRIREINVYTEIHPFNKITKSLFQKLDPLGVILSGGPNSVLKKNAPNISNVILNQEKPILAELSKLPPNKRKTILSALVVLTNKKEYREAMLNDINDYNKQIAKQEKTKNQEENWLKPEVLDNKLEQLKKNADLLYKKKNLTASDLQQIQNYILLLFFSGEYFPPRRSKDLCDFKIKNIDKEKDNYLNKHELVFNSYKTAKNYGTQ